MKDMPTVSVIMLTYNHEKFLQKAIYGIFIQKTNFIIELIIANDNSPDHSDSVIQQMRSNSPGHVGINYLKREVNLGANLNFKDAINKAKGKYIAMCEGDDYWTDPLKLQKQVDYLEENQDCNLVSHRVHVFDDETKTMSEEALNNPEITVKRTLEDLALLGNFMHTPSVMFRNNIVFSPKLFQGVIGDYVVWFLNGEKGKYGYIPDYMAVYRTWAGGVWSKKKLFFGIYECLKMLRVLMKHTNNKMVKTGLRTQALRISDRLDISGLSLREKKQFLSVMFRIYPKYIFVLFKKFFNLFFRKV
ncbi:glycosyltransferase family 2 protein [Mucilaginibacter lappiensis]|uniref:Glycosyltransferase involved in cell wall biosynthesis n=1 Tax=Mucilaginibacter lappiensis TaxID=354630 RepID=A0A841JME8_9SPHI|nr:glycosyltransferase [Mucilaginibacter lappiensis]MBB6130766.1 glycosyltransferase involved in cell wall biosynthesis [Mucilaginibacter lappiensis]